jgi:flavin-dependent dehydrogenase
MPATESCDVLVVGGGPAGSSCATALRQRGIDVMVVDAAVFPRDKVCAGWITPQVVRALNLDLDDYRRGRTFQPITGFQTGLIGGNCGTRTDYGRPVSYGIRRCEFDRYLLDRSSARVRQGVRVSSIRRDGAGWIVNGNIRAAMLVGAGGHFCPVARWLNPTEPAAPLVAAQEVEFAIGDDRREEWRATPDHPELYFWRDLKGYGWCFRKERYLNIGFGRLDRRSLPRAGAEFLGFLRARRRIPAGASWRWRGHAYYVAAPIHRRLLDAGILLAGDAAGLAYPQSGEGIRPAIESGLMAAAAVAEADGCYSASCLAPYERHLRERYGLGSDSKWVSDRVAGPLTSGLVPALLNTGWFVRHVVLNRWFLHAHEPALQPA